MSLGKHEPPQPGPGLQELVPDAAVVAHAEQHIVHVGAHCFANRGDGIYKRQLRRKKGVAGVLDRLGRSRVGDHDRRARTPRYSEATRVAAD